MTDALMPHGLSCLSNLLNNPQHSGFSHVTSKAIPRRFYHLKTPLDDIMQKSVRTCIDKENNHGKLPYLQIPPKNCGAAIRIENVKQFEDDEDKVSNDVLFFA